MEKPQEEAELKAYFKEQMATVDFSDLDMAIDFQSLDFNDKDHVDRFMSEFKGYIERVKMEF